MLRNIFFAVASGLAACGAITLWIIIKHSRTVGKMSPKEAKIATKAMRSGNYQMFDKIASEAEGRKKQKVSGDIFHRASLWLSKYEVFSKEEVDELIRGLVAAVEAARKGRDEADKERSRIEAELRRLQVAFEAVQHDKGELEAINAHLLERVTTARKKGHIQAAETAEAYGTTAFGKAHGKKVGEIIRGLE